MTDSASGQDATAREAVGGLWEVIGPLQFRFLLDEGLQPHQTVLDLGCGCLRGGVHYVKYLADGHYYGIEAACWLLEAGRDELARAGLGDRRVHLLCRDDFDCSSFGTAFDFAIAQSLFTHLPWNSIQRCLTEAEKVLAPDGRLYATFFEGSSIVGPEVHQPGGVVTRSDSDPYHYPFDVLADLARRTGLSATYLGEWGHPRAQRMIRFTKS